MSNVFECSEVSLFKMAIAHFKSPEYQNEKFQTFLNEQLKLALEENFEQSLNVLDREIFHLSLFKEMLNVHEQVVFTWVKEKYQKYSKFNLYT